MNELALRSTLKVWQPWRSEEDGGPEAARRGGGGDHLRRLTAWRGRHGEAQEEEGSSSPLGRATGEAESPPQPESGSHEEGCGAAPEQPPRPSGPRCARRPQRPSSAAAAAQLYLLVPLSVRTPPTAAPRRAEAAARSDGGAVPLDMRQPRQEPRLSEAPEDPPPPQQPPPSRPSVITCAPGRSPPTRPRIAPPPPLGLLASSADDPDIDEHFRRSLGSDYQHLFSRGCGKGHLWPMDTPAADSDALSVKFSGNSVDDHFAKALGETWHQLQQREEGAMGCEDRPWHQLPPGGCCDERQEDVGSIIDGAQH